MLHAAGSDQGVRKLAHNLCLASQQNNLKATMRVKMHMRCCNDALMISMLELGEFLGEPAGMMVVYQDQNPKRVGIVPRRAVVDECGAHERTYRLAPVCEPVCLAVRIEIREQLRVNGHAEPQRFIAHWRH